MQWKTIHCMPKYRNEFDGNVMQEIVLRLIYYRMGGVFLYTKELTPLVAFVGTFIVCYVSSVIIAGCKYTKFLC